MSSQVEDVLERINARRSFKNLFLELREQVQSKVVDESIWRILQSIDVGELERMGLSLGAEVDGKEIVKKLIPGNVVGAARLASDLGVISLVIEPKVSAKRLVSIMDFIQGRYFTDEEAESYGGTLDLLTIQVVRCVKLVKKSLSSGSIRGYKPVETELPYIKGRVDFSRFLLDKISGRSNVRCSYSELTIDTPRNRVFRLALVKCAMVLGERGQTDLFKVARMALYSLSAVTEQDFSQADIARIIKDNPRDSMALLACMDVIFRLSISPHPGHARNFYSYAINMATLFESYCHKLIEHAVFDEGIKSRSSLIFPVEGIDEPIRLDGLYEGDDIKILIECKYKLIASVNDVNRSDIYQSISYSCHFEVRPQISIIMFPAIEPKEAANIMGSIGGFDISSKKLYVVSVDMNSSPSQVISCLKPLLKGLLGK